MKTNLSNVPYQSQFLPLIQEAEFEIKKLVQFYAYHLLNKNELRDKIKGIIKAVDEKLPISLYEREVYIDALYKMSEKMIREFYDVITTRYFFIMSVIAYIGLKDRPKNVIELLKVEADNRELIAKGEKELWSKAKGSPYVPNYGNLVRQRVRDLAEAQTTTDSGITLWQKAELDIRHENQMNKLNDLIDSGTRYAFTSSHPDCSKRCEKWQGKLFDIQAEHSELSGFRMRKRIDGHTVYCLKEVIKQKDKYGYENNIIVGFNCRHHLIPYDGQVPPEEYTEKEVKEQREINSKLREFERKIRFHKQQAILYNVNDPKLARKHKLYAENLMTQYKRYAQSKGYAWYEYRVKI